MPKPPVNHPTLADPLLGNPNELAAIWRALDRSAMVLVADTDGRFVYVNDKTSEISGYSWEDLIGEDARSEHWGCVPVDSDSKAPVWETLARNEAWHGELVCPRKDGALFWVEGNFIPLLDDNGKSFGFMAIHYDITERKQAGEDLKHSNAELAAIWRALDRSVMVVVSDTERNILSVNDKMCVRLQRTREELLGLPVFTYFSPTLTQQTIEEASRQLEAGHAWHGEMPLLTKDGTEFWTDTTIVPFLDENGKAFRFISIRQDITKRKCAEEKLKQSLTELGDIKRALDRSSMVVVSDANRIILYVNDKFCERLQRKPEELIGQPVYVFLSEKFPKKTITEIITTIDRGENWQGEIPHTAKDGTEFWTDTTIVPFFDEEGKPFRFISIRHDITEQKRIEVELRHMNEELEQRVNERTLKLQKALVNLKENEELKETFITALTHDLRTPLIAQQRVLDIFSRHHENLPPELAPMAESLLKSNQDTLDLVNKLLEIYHYESEEITPEREEIDLASFIENCFTEISTMAQSHRIFLENNVTGGTRPLYADPQLLKRVLMNLLGNALANIPEKSRVRVSASDTPYASLIEISDNGPGIPPEMMPHLFDRFFHARSKHKKLGSGLGLSICKMIMELHGGSIAVESKPGKGTAFLLTFPKQES